LPQKTRPLEPWEGIRDALELPPMAIPWVRPANWAESADVRAQYSEDCLYLNLFRPHPPDAEGNDDDGNGGSSKEKKVNNDEWVVPVNVTYLPPF
jgi:hypothetical protein